MKWVTWCLITALAGCLPASAQETLPVVATLSTFGDLVKTIGGEHVTVTTIASPQFNPHFIEPKPSDVLSVKKAALFVHAGLDLEVWRGPMVDAAGNLDVRPGQSGELDLSHGIPLLEIPDRNVTRAEGDIHLFGNPHYWTNPENGRIMARSVERKLSELLPTHADVFKQNLAAFEARLDEKIPEWKERVKPFAGYEVIGYHNEWPYLMDFLGLTMKEFLEPKPGVPPSPRHISALTEYIKTNPVHGVIQSAYFPMRSTKAFAERTGIPVILLCQNVKEVKAASDYIAMVQYNIDQLAAALHGQ